MKYCKNCHVKVDANRNHCPLCFREIKQCDDVQTDDLPFMERTKNEHESKKQTFIIKLFSFISLCAIAICTLVNCLVDKSFLWCLVVISGIVYVWIIVGHTILSRRGVFEKIFVQLLGIMFVLWACERISANSEHWVANYVFPSVSMCTVATMLMIAFIRKDKTWVLAFFLITAVLTVASVLFFVYLDDFKTMGIINIAFCSLTLIGYLTFAYNVIKGEFLKKFHL